MVLSGWDNLLGITDGKAGGRKSEGSEMSPILERAGAKDFSAVSRFKK